MSRYCQYVVLFFLVSMAGVACDEFGKETKNLRSPLKQGSDVSCESDLSLCPSNTPTPDPTPTNDTSFQCPKVENSLGLNSKQALPSDRKADIPSHCCNVRDLAMVEASCF